MRTTIRNGGSGISAGVALFFACAGLSACNEMTATAPNADAGAQFVMRSDANMADATVAIASVDGPPADISTRFRQSFDQAAAARRIAVVEPAKARYLVRGYLTASPIEGGAEVDVVWDVFTSDKKRAQRLSDTIAVKGSGEDAWAMIDDAAMNSVSAKCADDLAAYLSNTPEAAPPPGAALSYAQ